MNHALPSESYIARLDYLAFNGKVCSSVEYSDEQRFLEDLKESLYHGEPLCVVLYRDRNGKTISRAFLNDLDTLPKGLFICKCDHVGQSQSYAKFPGFSGHPSHNKCGCRHLYPGLEQENHLHNRIPGNQSTITPDHGIYRKQSAEIQACGS